MSRMLKRVPLSFDWPLNKVWRGFLNPYYTLRKECPDCAGSGYSPRAKRFHDEWYGHSLPEFDPVAYGARPLTLDHPKIHDMAVRNVNRSPDFYMTPEERLLERENRRRAGVDLWECLNYDPEPEEMRPQPGLVRIENHRGPAIEREQKRLFEECFRHSWMHHLIQADVDALVAHGRLWDFTNRPLNQEQVEKLKQQEAAGRSRYWLDEPNGHHPTADEVNDWSIGGMGHDGCNAGVCIDARCAREGVPVRCARCGGNGNYWVDVEYRDLPVVPAGCIKHKTMLAIKRAGRMVPAKLVKKLYDEWEDYEPPVGEGYQLWEDCSEGSPISPVFTTLDDLCAWAEHNATTFGSFTTTAAEWRRMLGADFVCHKEGNNIFM